jgi:transglutaminase-like putative cysteine protease
MASMLTVRHVTTYRYRQPVAFGEHRMMLRPRDSSDQRVVAADLAITPNPASLRFIYDAFGNHLGIANFSGRSRELHFESTVCIEHSPVAMTGLEIEAYARAFPFEYSADEVPDLAGCIARRHPDPGNEVGRWARRFTPQKGVIGTFELLEALTRGIYETFRYRRREAKGIQEPLETLELGHGSCRDFAMLMIEAARSLGFAARFASGYLAIPLDDPFDPKGGSTHAWAQVYLPGAGWVDFDPTSGKVGNNDLVTVAVVRDPLHATPLHGTFFGSASDPLGMHVEVSVMSGARSEIRAAPRNRDRAERRGAMSAALAASG